MRPERTENHESTSASLREAIANFIREEVTRQSSSALFAEPLIGFARCDDPAFLSLKTIIGAHHLLPEEVLPKAKSAVAFFLPYRPEIVISNRGSAVSREWAEAYLKANDAIDAIGAALCAYLAGRGFDSIAVGATHTYDPESLTASWSHRSVAFIAGLGRFGLNRLLITAKGSAGRYGSVLTTADIPADPRPEANKEEEPCTYFRDGGCRFCLQNCPTGALSEEGIDRQLCNAYLLKVSEGFSDLGFCDVCGKCAVGPCALSGVR